MSYKGRFLILLMGLIGVVATAVPAAAQISLRRTLTMPKAPRYDAAFDSVNKVYLLLVEGPPVRGQFMNQNGQLVGPAFDISVESASGTYAAWSTVTFGGTTADPTFLVTYLAIEGSLVPKYARLVRYRAGAAPSISGRLLMHGNVGAEWFAADRSRAVWTAGRFVVGTRTPASPYPQPQIQTIDLAGNVSGPIIIGNAIDYQAGPSLACTPDSTCMAVGFAAGNPFGGTTGAIWARIFNGATLAMNTGVFHLDDHSSVMDTPFVVWNAHAGKFSTVWYRRDPGSRADFRVVGPDGTMGPLDLTKSVGPGAGDISLSYNPVTGTSLLATKLFSEADLYGMQLGDDGYPIANSTILLQRWDGKWPEYRTTTAASTDGAQWITTYAQALTSGIAFVQTPAFVDTGGGTPPPPSPTPPPPPVIKALPVADPDTTGSSAQLGAQTLYLQSDSGQLASWRLSNFSLADGSMLNPGQLADPKWQIVGSGDVNHDGMPDLFWSHSQTGALAVWLMNGTALMESRMLTPDRLPSTSWRVVSTKDMNADGDPDLVLQHTNGNVAIWFLHGTALWDGAMLPFNNTDPAWKVVGAADLNADGWNDLVWQRTDGSIATWSMRGATFLEGQLLSPGRVSDTNWEIRGVTDVNGDGKPDLVWQHRGNNAIAATTLNGIAVIDSVFLTPDTIAPGWHIVGPR